VNVRTHIAGIYASLVERAETSPYDIAQAVEGADLSQVVAEIHARLAPLHEVAIGAAEAGAYRDALVAELLAGSDRLKAGYGRAKERVGSLFAEWLAARPPEPRARTLGNAARPVPCFPVCA
jgi:hypothetical protein